MEMSEHFKIDCNLVDDRRAIAAILAYNGYVVRMGKEKIYFVEYWRGDDERENEH